MKKNFRIAFFSILITASVFTGCKKEKADTDTNAAADNATAENYFNDIGRLIDNAAQSSKYLDPQSTVTNVVSCPTITIDHPDSTTWPKTVTIDFGTTNCYSWGLIPHRGKLIATFSGPYRASGTVITITTDNFYRNDNKIEGTKTVTNAGTNNSGQMYFNITVANAKITRTDNTFMTWSSTRTRTWIQGQSTVGDWTDDAYEITGVASGITFTGNAFSASITNPLEIAWGCRWIKSGTINLTPTGLALRTIDFGSGNCDNEATVTINGNVYNFTMP